MKKILGLALAGALSVAALPAVAADYPVKAPPPPIWTWTGFYIGVQAGAGWSHTNWVNTVGVATGDFQGSGGELGGTIGWNWQAPGSPWVFGIEADASWTNIQAVTAAAACGTTCTSRLDWFGTVRARLGHANGPLLFYVTGGWAWGELTHTLVAGGLSNTQSDGASGWTVGAGLEGALGGAWTLKAEYLYVDLGTSVACSVGFCAFQVNDTYFRTHILRAGVNYKF